MRVLLIASLAIAACSDDGGPSDALEGAWAVAWTCTAGCEHPPIELATAAALTIEPVRLVIETAPPSGFDVTREADCARLAGGVMPHPRDIGWTYEPFDACALDGALSGEFYVIRNAGEIQSRWRFDGARE